MSSPDREEEQALLSEWFRRISFDKPSEGLPPLDPEKGDD